VQAGNHPHHPLNMDENPFTAILEGRTIIVGVGNTLRGDDGAGPALVERLERMSDLVHRGHPGRGNHLEQLGHPGRWAGNHDPRFRYMNAGSAPERFLGKAFRENPDTLLLVDALHLGLPPGCFRIMRLEEVDEACTSTHDLSLNTLVAEADRCLRSGETATGPRVFVLGIQPARLGLGEGLSPPVEEALRLCERLILAAAPT
ncbi:MAG: hydrogenase 3 maturation endopeptidase HyCI, partial [Spirochaetota bacterium]